MGLQTLSALCKVYLNCNLEMLTMNETQNTKITSMNTLQYQEILFISFISTDLLVYHPFSSKQLQKVRLRENT